MGRFFPIVFILAACGSAGAQSSLGLMDVDLMFVGAHPDDDSGVMATFARYILDEGFRGTVVTATGGDGGGNAIGPEAGRSLALIRKEEERRALSLVGVDAPAFLGLTDFYFTLSAEETESKWGTSFVCDVVRYVRLQRPEVIITMWPGPGTHGQHQMAARAATIAFDQAADPEVCAAQINAENLQTFQPLKLYYYNRTGPASVEIPTDDFSRARNMRYADIRALGMAKYRSQGFDQFLKIPVEETRPERFMLVRSMVPVSTPETHLLGGALLAAGASPPGIGLRIDAESFEVSSRRAVPVHVALANHTPQTLDAVVLEFSPPPGFSADGAPARPSRLAPGETLTRTFSVTHMGAGVDENARFVASYQGTMNGREVAGENASWLRAAAPVRARFEPLYDVDGYRRFARDTGTEWVIETLPARVPLVIGRRNTVQIQISADDAASGTLRFETPDGITAPASVAFNLSAGEMTSVPVALEVDERVLPEGRHAVRAPISVVATAGSSTSRDTADVYALPYLEVPRVFRAPVIDGELSDGNRSSCSEISPADRWWRREPDGAADSSATFCLSYDDEFLYAAVRVLDDAVICNIAPDDVRAQLRSDAVGITVDPSGASRDTSTVIQAAAFPCTTDGFGARGFRDADANQGLMEETAPGMEVASMKTDDGYVLEARIPWSAMPETPERGAEIAVNVIIYDGDLKNARVGANISESGLGWAAFSWGGKQALPYLWPRVRLEP